MIAEVAIAGPSSPQALADHLHEADRKLAAGLPGLGGWAVNNLARALLDAGVTVELTTLAPELTEPVTLAGSKLRIYAAPYRAAGRARDLFRAERRHVAAGIDGSSAPVVNAHWTYEFALGALRAGRPTVVTARDAPLTILRHERDVYRLVRAAMAFATRLRRPHLVANSPYLARALRRQMLHPAPIPVVPNVVAPLPEPGPTGTRSAGGPILLDVANISRGKNLPALIAALPSLIERHPDLRLRLVGPGLGPESRLVALARRLGVEAAIEFAGPVDRQELGVEYDNATLFVHPAREESFGMAVAEAMAHGLPVLASAGAGAVPWLLGEGKCGMLLDEWGPAATADAISKLLEDEALRTRLSDRAKRRIETAFSPAAVVPLALEQYELAQRRRSA